MPALLIHPLVDGHQDFHVSAMGSGACGVLVCLWHTDLDSCSLYAVMVQLSHTVLFSVFLEETPH